MKRATGKGGQAKHSAGQISPEQRRHQLETYTAFSRFAKTKDGRVIMRYLEETFRNRPLCRDTEHLTVFAAAQADVITHINGILEVADQIVVQMDKPEVIK